MSFSWLMIDVGGAHLTVVDVNPGQVVLVGIRKWAEQDMGNKPVSSMLPWSLLQFLTPDSCLEFLSLLPSMMDHTLVIKANQTISPSRCFWSECLITAIREQTGTDTKIPEAPVPYVKWLSVCKYPTHITPNLLNNLYTTYDIWANVDAR